MILARTPSNPLPAAVTVAALQTAFFGATQSVDAFWRENSYGKTSATGSVFGPFTLDADYTCDQQNAIATAVIKAADSAVDWTQYQRIVIVVPNVGTCAIGQGSIGCRNYSSTLRGAFTSSVVWLRRDYLTQNDAIVSIAAHELGHNLLLQHSSTLTFPGIPLGPPGTGSHVEYGDFLAVMGLSFNYNGSLLLPHYAAQHKSILGWFGSGNVQTVTSSGSFVLLPVETPTTGTQVLRVRRGSGSQYLWIEFKRPLGFEATLVPFGYNFDGAFIRYEDPALPYNANYTHALNFHPASTSLTTYPLAVGESWSDPYSTLSLRVSSATASGLSLDVSYGSPCATLVPLSTTLDNTAQQSTISVTAGAGCSWYAVSNSSWISIVSGSSGTGSGTVTFALTANTSAQSRTGTITINGQDVTITQSGVPTGCTYTLNPTAARPGPKGGPGSANVNTGPGCGWTASSSAAWIQITSGTGSGAGTITYSVLPNPAGVRSGTVAIGSSQTSITQPGPLYSPVRSFRGTSASDIFVYNSAAAAGYAGLSNGAGGYSFVYTPVTPGFDILRTLDVNGDGKSDIVVYRSSDGLGYTGIGTGSGTFNFQSLFWSPGYTNVEIGDFNNDGKGDVFLYRSADGTSYTGLSNGDGTWTFKYALVSIGFTHVRTGDVNGDGKTDVFLYRSSDGAAFLGLGNGDGTFTFSPVNAGPGYDFVEEGDIDADGRADLILYSSASGAFKVGISTGTNFNFTVQSFSPGFSSVKVLDQNGDGRADVVLYNRATAVGYLGLGAGNGTFTFGSVFWGPGFDYVETQDVNGDGRADVVLYNSATGTAYTGTSNGAGGFTYVYSYLGPGRLLAR